MAKTKKKRSSPKNQGFLVKLIAKAKKIKKRSSPEIQAFFMVKTKINRSSPGDEGHFGSSLVHIYHWKKKVARRMAIKGRRPGKMPWRIGSGPRAVGCWPLSYGLKYVYLLCLTSLLKGWQKSLRLNYNRSNTELNCSEHSTCCLANTLFFIRTVKFWVEAKFNFHKFSALFKFYGRIKRHKTILAW